MAVKSEYYQKLVLNGTVEDLIDLLDQVGNDNTITEEEREWIENSIQRRLSMFKGTPVRIVNVESGVEEEPPQTIYDEFSGSSIYKGEISMYGLKWKMFVPSIKFGETQIKYWYFNEKVASILSDILLPVIPGRFRGYFSYPPWLLGTSYAPHTYYIPTESLISMAIDRNIIDDWNSLVQKGIPRTLVERYKSRNLGNAF